jgi:hypothetical protein
MTKLLRILKMAGVFFVSGAVTVAAIILLGWLAYTIHIHFGAAVFYLALIFGICIIGATIAEEMY